jgi:hypothetical protein
MIAIFTAFVFLCATQIIARIYLSLFLKSTEKNRGTGEIGTKRKIKYFFKAIFFFPLLTLMLFVEGFLGAFVEAEKDAYGFNYSWNAFFAVTVFVFGNGLVTWFLILKTEMSVLLGIFISSIFLFMWLLASIFISRRSWKKHEKLIFYP